MKIPFIGNLSFNKKSDLSSFGTNSVVVVNNGIIEYLDYVNIYISASQAYDMFDRVSAVSDAVGKISMRASIIPMIIKDKNETSIKEHEILTLLNKPNALGKINFWERAVTSHSLTNESYIIARGRIERPPVSLEIAEAWEVQEGNTNRLYNRPETYRTGEADNNRVYSLKIINGKIRYIDETGLNELIPIVGVTYRNSFRGRSKLVSLVEEVKHIRKGNQHNTSLLDNGMNASSIMSPDNQDIDEDKGLELASVLKKHHQGSQNAGKPLIMPIPMKIIGQSTTNRDMDYIALIDIDETRVYRTFNIPLPLVKSQSMTQSNYEASIPYLYTDAILPVYSSIAEGITNGLFQRYPDLKDKRLTYDKFGIPAMEAVFIKNMKELAGTGVSVNELRAKGGYIPVEKGDKPLISAGLKTYDEDSLFAGYPDGQNEG